jgi:hypothetical protein
MSRAQARDFLRLEAVRTEPLQDISELDIRREGICLLDDGAFGLQRPRKIRGATPREAFENLWDRIHPKNPWETNPQVVVLSFTRIEQPAAKALAQETAIHE